MKFNITTVDNFYKNLNKGTTIMEENLRSALKFNWINKLLMSTKCLIWHRCIFMVFKNDPRIEEYKKTFPTLIPESVMMDYVKVIYQLLAHNGRL